MNEHESKHRFIVKPPSDRIFGIFFSFIFFIIGIYPVALGNSIRPWAFFISTFFLISSLLIPSFLTPLNSLWMRLGSVLHLLISPFALGFIFFGSILPTGFFLRSTGKDLLNRNFDPNIDTYWINRIPPGPSSNSFINQF